MAEPARQMLIMVTGLLYQLEIGCVIGISVGLLVVVLISAADETNEKKIHQLKGKCHGVFELFFKKGEIRPLLSYKIILEQQEERNQLNS